MPYKLLSNLIAPGSIQHMAGEVVDLEDSALASSLVKRGIAEAVDSPATHIFGQLATGASRGGKPVNEPEQPATPAVAPSAEPKPQDPAEDEEDAEADEQIEKATAVGTPATPAPQQPTAADIANDPQLK